jgi:hypothetical protein
MAWSLSLPNSVLVWRNRAGEIVDTLLVLPADEQMRIADGGRITAKLLAAQPVWGVAHGNVLVARSTEMRVEVRSLDGALNQVFTLDSTPVPVSEARREELTRTLQAVPSIEIEIHPNLPMVVSLFEGPEGTIWVQSAIDDDPEEEPGSEWHIFDREGRFRGTLELGNFSPSRTVQDKVYGIARDELGVQYVVRMRIEGL